MCAVILGNPFGEIRGKLGGSIFSRNGSMQYIKSYAVPVNPNSGAQNAVRSYFANATKSWSILSPIQRAHWNEYAKFHFVPRTQSHSNKYSGYQAFVSCSVASQSALFNEVTWYESAYDGDPSEDVCHVNFLGVNGDSPEGGKQSNIVDVNGNVYPLTLSNCTVNDQARCEFRINFVGASPTTEFRECLDTSGNYGGFAVYISTATKAKGMYINDNYKYNVGYVRPIRACSPPTVNLYGSGIDYVTNTPIDLSDYVAFPHETEWVRMTVLSIGAHGNLSLIGTQEIQVQAS